jgi:hypothetical protein
MANHSDSDTLDNFVTELLARLSSSLDEASGGTGFAEIGVSIEIAKRTKSERLFRLILRGCPSRKFIVTSSQFDRWAKKYSDQKNLVS